MTGLKGGTEDFRAVVISKSEVGGTRKVLNVNNSESLNKNEQYAGSIEDGKRLF